MAKKADAANDAKSKKVIGGVNALENAIAQIRKDFGDGAIMKLGEIEAGMKIDVISTGSFSLDMALGVWGLPRGRIVEVYGQESSGKTTLTLHVIANAQKNGGVAAFIDVEHALDPSYARKIGVDTNSLLIAQPNSGEEALNIAETLARSGQVDIIVIDSVAALTPKAELDGEIGDAFVGTQARLMSQAMRKLTSVLAQTKTLCIFTNQVREKIGVMFGSPETTPGGKALKFYASVRLNISRIQQIKDKAGTSTGNRTRVKVVKNKVAPPFTEAEFDIMFNRGIWWEGSVLEAALKQGIVQKRGSWLSYGTEQIAQGQDASALYLEQHPEMLARLFAECKAAGKPTLSAPATENSAENAEAES